MTNTTITKVIFRKWNAPNSGILALFPQDPADYSGYQCSSYEHVGQHGGADYEGCIQATVPATPDEYAALKLELERIGYVLRVCRRAAPSDRDKRIAEARSSR